MNSARRPLRLLSLALCLFLAAVATAAWVRTQVDQDVVAKSAPGGRYYEWATIPGQLRFTVVKGWAGVDQPLRWYRGNPPPPVAIFGHQVLRDWSPAGFTVTDGRRPVPAPGAIPGKAAVRVTYRIYTIPLAPLVLLFAAYPLAITWRTSRSRRRRRERIRQGLCPRCGYDLRASTGRCPECGAAAPPALAVATG